MSDKRYLGDGVYVEIERGMAKLTAKSGGSQEATIYNTIYLEQSVISALIDWLNQTYLEWEKPNNECK